MKIDPNASAFPIPGFDIATGVSLMPKEGISIRAYFAAMAMQGILADNRGTGRPSNYAEDAVQYADALIAELNK